MYSLSRLLIVEKCCTENLLSKFHLFLLLLYSSKILNIWLKLIFISGCNFFFFTSSSAISSMTVQYAQLQALYLQWSQSPINLLMNWYWLYFLQAGNASKGSYLIFKMSPDQFFHWRNCKKKKKNQLEMLIGSIIPVSKLLAWLEAKYSWSSGDLSVYFHPGRAPPDAGE